ASLDLDDVTSYGPETMTICQRYPYTMHYFVYNYSNDSYQDVSDYAKVVVRKSDGSIYEIVPPSSNPNEYNYWKVFDVDSDGNIIIINEYVENVEDE
ncbi:MAG: hypothetical protein GXO11_02940, partial [Epsilonproteobacteria bacterium]|nr:hypothetical protein [Campylobacterota bacterium]